jgi:predicted MFS family arabinose efflux permease
MPVPREYSRARFGMMAMFAAHGIAMASWYSRIPAIAERVDASSDVLGLVLLAMAVSSLFSMQVTGQFMSRLGASRVIRVAGPLSYSMLGLSVMTRTPVQAAAALFVVGCANGALTVALNTQSTAVVRAAGRPWLPSILGCYSVASIGSALVGAFAVAHHVSVVTHIGICVAVGVVVNVLAGRRIAVVHASRGPVSSDTAVSEASVSGPVVAATAPVRAPTLGPGVLVLYTLAAIGFAAAFGEGVMANFGALVFRHIFDSSTALATVSYVLFCAAMAGGRMLGGPTAARIGSLRVIMIGGAIALASSLVMMTVPLSGAGLLAAAGIGLGLSCGVPLCLGLFDTAARRRLDPSKPPAVAQRAVGVAISRFSTATSIGSLLGGPIAGFVAGVATLRASMGIVTLAGATLAFGGLYLWRSRANVHSAAKPVTV